jgi:hypothetical protein
LAENVPVVGRKVLAFDITKIAQSGIQRREQIAIGGWREIAEPCRLRRLLRTDGKRPSRHRATNERYELAPLHTSPKTYDVRETRYCTCGGNM